MKTVEMSEATASLSDYARKVREGPIIITIKGRPVAALTAVGPETDIENLTVSNDPRFLALIARSRARHKPGTGIPIEEVRRRFGLKARRPKRVATERGRVSAKRRNGKR